MFSELGKQLFLFMACHTSPEANLMELNFQWLKFSLQKHFANCMHVIFILGQIDGQEVTAQTVLPPRPAPRPARRSPPPGRRGGPPARWRPSPPRYRDRR